MQQYKNGSSHIFPSNFTALLRQITMTNTLVSFHERKTKITHIKKFKNNALSHNIIIVNIIKMADQFNSNITTLKNIEKERNIHFHS